MSHEKGGESKGLTHSITQDTLRWAVHSMLKNLAFRPTSAPWKPLLFSLSFFKGTKHCPDNSA